MQSISSREALIVGFANYRFLTMQLEPMSVSKARKNDVTHGLSMYSKLFAANYRFVMRIHAHARKRASPEGGV